MSNYQETQISGTSHKRAHQIIIHNTYGINPIVQFREEVIAQVGEQQFREDAGAMSISPDMEKVVPILNPLTGEATGQSMTMGEGYAFIYSAYIQAALERDAAQAEPEPDPEPEPEPEE